MKIQSIKQQNNSSFRGLDVSKLSSYAANHPGVVAAIAGSSVVTQKLVMTATEATLGASMDLAVGKAITKASGEKDGRTNQSAKVQAVRTFSQTTGGAITGVTIRALCISAMTFALMKSGGKIGEMLSKATKMTGIKNIYEKSQKASAIGKTLGGVVATVIMLGTNFLLDVPIINFINKKISDVVFKKDKDKEVANG